MREKTRKKQRLNERLRQIDKDLLSVQDRIREISGADTGPAVFSTRGARPPVRPPAARAADNGGAEPDGQTGSGDKRFANYLASSFEARQPLNAEPGTRRNKFVFIAAVAVFAFVAWILAVIL